MLTSKLPFWKHNCHLNWTIQLNLGRTGKCKCTEISAVELSLFLKDAIDRMTSIPVPFWSGSSLPYSHSTILPHPTLSSCWCTRKLRLHPTTMHLLFTRKYREGFFCVGTTGPEVYYELLVYSSVISVVMFAVPFMVVMVCYSLMVRKLLGPSWGSGERQQGLRAAHRTKQKSVKMIIIVLMTFMFCFLPFHLTRSLFYSFRYLRDKHPEQVSDAHIL